MPPLQARGQLLSNLHYIFKHQPPLPYSTPLFVLNRVFDTRMSDRVVSLLVANGVELDTQLLTRTIDWGIPRADVSATYFMDINGARNLALDEARKRGIEWVDLNDGNIFVTAHAWAELIQVISRREFDVILKPMARLAVGKSDILDRLSPNSEEAQVTVRTKAPLRFEEGLAYGRRNKLALLSEYCGTAFPATGSITNKLCAVLTYDVFRLFSFPPSPEAKLAISDNTWRFYLRRDAINRFMGAVRAIHCRKNPRQYEEDMTEVLERYSQDLEWARAQPERLPPD